MKISIVFLLVVLVVVVALTDASSSSSGEKKYKYKHKKGSGSSSGSGEKKARKYLKKLINVLPSSGSYRGNDNRYPNVVGNGKYYPGGLHPLPAIIAPGPFGGNYKRRGGSSGSSGEKKKYKYKKGSKGSSSSGEKKIKKYSKKLLKALGKSKGSSYRHNADVVLPVPNSYVPRNPVPAFVPGGNNNY